MRFVFVEFINFSAISRLTEISIVKSLFLYALPFSLIPISEKKNNNIGASIRIFIQEIFLANNA